MAKLLDLRPDSKQSGLCDSCIHKVGDKCNTGKTCGQIMACRGQAKAMVVGRYSNGRIRKAPLKRIKKEKPPKVSAWKLTYQKLAQAGDNRGCVWLGFLSDSNQTTVRRLIKRGDISVVYIPGVTLRHRETAFVNVSDLNKHFKNWRVNYGH